MTTTDWTLWTLAVEFAVYGRPQQRGSKSSRVKYNDQGQPIAKNGRVLTFAVDDNEKSKAWMSQVRDSAAAAWGLNNLIVTPCALSVEYYFARPRSHYGTGRNAGALRQSAPRRHAHSPDLAKLTRCLEDALTGVVWLDDKLVCEYLPPFGRRWSDGSEQAVVRIYTVSELHPANQEG